jgi:hypothetical protein
MKTLVGILSCFLGISSIACDTGPCFIGYDQTPFGICFKNETEEDAETLIRQLDEATIFFIIEAEKQFPQLEGLLEPLFLGEDGSCAVNVELKVRITDRVCRAYNEEGVWNGDQCAGLQWGKEITLRRFPGPIGTVDALFHEYFHMIFRNFSMTDISDEPEGAALTGPMKRQWASLTQTGSPIQEQTPESKAPNP